ncbi:hypothetical protein ACIRNY_12275 [Capnocytophaga canimorsus]|uniref:Beta-carotene 15,15'-monooxygenase n=1 Tax=Capnocytophaga canimorsus TaxID=28188 RepID=A0A0B7ID52_9FLAO|nr:hypothetical protein [Capnocytophaga canimorsus]CEN48634.1 conserved membrane hypothetical protein [Capnocytophaga canimorsus]
MNDISSENKPRPTLSMPNVVRMAFHIYRQTLLVTTPVALLLFVVCFGLYSWLLPSILGMPLEKFIAMVNQNDIENLTLLVNSKRFLIASNLFVLLISCLIAPMSAGFYNVFEKFKENTLLNAREVFNHYNSEYTARIIGYVVLLWAIKLSISLLLMVINLQMFSFWFQVLLSVFFTLTIPYIILQDKPLFSAIKSSIKSVSPYLFLVFVSLIVGIVFTLSGTLLCAIGIAATLPFLYAVNYVLFEFLKR